MYYVGFFGFIGFLIYSLLKPSFKRSLLLAILGVFIAFVGLSRIYLGQHWASDVLGSYLLGSLTLVGFIQVYLWGKTRFFIHQPVDKASPQKPQRDREKPMPLKKQLWKRVINMSKKNKPIRVKLIANPGAGDVVKSAARLEEVAHYLIDAGLSLDVALAKPKKEAIPIAQQAVKDGYDVVVGMGGDGTLASVIRGIAGSEGEFRDHPCWNAK